MAIQMRAGEQGWVRASFGALLLMIAMGIVGGVRMRSLLRAGPRGESEDLPRLILDPVLQTSMRVRLVLLLEIVLLMVLRSDLLPSLQTGGMAIVLGLLWSATTWKSLHSS